MFKLIKTPSIFLYIFSKYTWRFTPKKQKTVYLTFDDGPTPEITEWVLSQLNKHQYKATFFCIGNNICKYPSILQKIHAAGHAIGNHTQHHKNGWLTNTTTYIKDFETCQKILAEHQIYTNLFRPPYGKIKKSQAKKMLNQHHKIIMWDVLSRDFDIDLDGKTCFLHTVKNIENGSIIVFHDSVKAFERLKICLPLMLDFLKENDYNCLPIPMNG